MRQDKYSNKEVRRQNRLLSKEIAEIILHTAEYGVLSLKDETKGAYGLPISYVWDGEGTIYFHSALEGRKITLINECYKVSFCVVGKTNVISNQFTTEYQSVILECEARFKIPRAEKEKALKLLITKYSPNDFEAGEKYIRNSFDNTEVIKLVIMTWSGKGKIID